MNWSAQTCRTSRQRPHKALRDLAKDRPLVPAAEPGNQETPEPSSSPLCASVSPGKVHRH